MAQRINARKICFQLFQFLQSGTQHHALAFAQAGIAVLVALRLEFQRQRADFLAPVQHQRFHQPGAHRAFQIKVGDDVREVQLAFVPAQANIVVRRGGKIHLHKASAFALGNAAQAFLPFHLAGLAFFLQLVDVMRLVVEHHQIG